MKMPFALRYVLAGPLLLLACGAQHVARPTGDAPPSGSVATSAAIGDTDGDGIPNEHDRCPTEPEDCDGIRDEDGCPEADADGDGIPDVCDECPLEPGSLHGGGDPNPKGCPFVDCFENRGDFLHDAVEFAGDSEKVSASAAALVKKTAEAMTAHHEIELFFVIGGATPKERGPDALSERRAASVAALLVSFGVDAKRVESHGAGAGGRAEVYFAVDRPFCWRETWNPKDRALETVPPPARPCDVAPPAPCRGEKRP
jgi:hypothetical protein